MTWWVLLVLVLAAGMVVEAHATCPTNVNVTTFCILTERGEMFEIEAPELVPTTDIVSSPYIEFQRIGGLVASGNSVVEAAQYNQVAPGLTHIIDNWGSGITYGIPNAAPLGGELRMSPVPHLYLRVLGPIPWPEGVDRVEMMAGSITHTVQNHTTFGPYHKFEGTGRAIIHMSTVNNHYAVNLVCSGCQTDTPAVIGNIPTLWGNPISTSLGTSMLSSGTSGICSVDTINHTGCGTYPTANPPRPWPVDPRPDLPEAVSHDPYPDHLGAVLNVTRYDTTACPGANHNNTEVIQLDDLFFQLSSQGCLMENYDYQWWDGSVRLTDVLPLRPGVSVWVGSSLHHPAIVLNMRGGTVLVQAYAANSQALAEVAFEDTLTVDAGSLVGPDDLVILHDAFSHLGAYTRSTLGQMANHVQTYPQVLPDPGQQLVSHNQSPGLAEIGGLLGRDCLPGYKYCITVFDNLALPAIHNAAGALYDPRNAVTLNRGTAVTNQNHVFYHSGTWTAGKVWYDNTVLNLIQAYAVIPITGSASVEKLYLVDSGSGCSAYVDDTTSPDSWSAHPGPGWLGMDYLEGDYGVDRTSINIPLLPGYGTACMMTRNSEEFRQFNMDNFFVQGAAASFGGMRYVSTFPGSPALHVDPDVSNIKVLHTDIVLPGEGVRVMDLDIDLSGSVLITGVVAGGGGIVSPNPAHACDWHRPLPSEFDPPRHTLTQSVVFSIDVLMEVPVGGTYQVVDGLSVSGIAQLKALQTPVSVGEDCRHMSYAGFDFAPEYRTIPINYGSNTPIRVSITTTVDFENGAFPEYAGARPAETMFVETFIDRLSVRVH